MGDSGTSVVAYEELRRRVLTGTGGSELGADLPSARRDDCLAGTPNDSRNPVRPAADQKPWVAAPVLSDEIHAGLVRLLANMALAGRREMTP